MSFLNHSQFAHLATRSANEIFMDKIGQALGSDAKYYQARVSCNKLTDTHVELVKKSLQKKHISHYLTEVSKYFDVNKSDGFMIAGSQFFYEVNKDITSFNANVKWADERLDLFILPNRSVFDMPQSEDKKQADSDTANCRELIEQQLKANIWL
ncbi:hypothetical protein GCM10007086_24620 [Photobacterium aphoticum]|uniref:Uncharacterized protein n=2 Tax=Photobacterium aphoticum TaxID=754436 RepID=A0A0J1GNA4_9GAMM|nr:hypothetical protein ABT58_08800 [Photobacterium aphoticum]PSU57010.1 hypothetical protein C9I90_10925 [Photobacterium aphoticum]GHA49790.1 hypothetical protein GCM10007086_24620 [Photobacterium aphoticum]